MPILSSIGSMSVGETGATSSALEVKVTTTTFLFKTNGIGVMSRFITVVGGEAPYQYTFTPALPAGVVFDSKNGIFTGTPTGATPTTQYELKITDIATPANSFTTYLTITTEVYVPPPLLIKFFTTKYEVVINTTVPTQTFVYASGGVPPYTFTANTTLPTGLTLTSNGFISGKPTTYTPERSYTFSVSDSVGQVTTATITMYVKPTPLIATVGTTANIIISQYAVSATYSLISASGGLPPYNYTIDVLTPLPSGLTLNQATGKITGLPTSVSSATYSYNVTDSIGTVAKGTFIINTTRRYIVKNTLTSTVVSSSITPPTTYNGVTGGWRLYKTAGTEMYVTPTGVRNGIVGGETQQFWLTKPVCLTSNVYSVQTQLISTTNTGFYYDAYISDDPSGGLNYPFDVILESDGPFTVSSFPGTTSRFINTTVRPQQFTPYTTLTVNK